MSVTDLNIDSNCYFKYLNLSKLVDIINSKILVNNPRNNQNTIYKMRWDHNTKGASYLHQYATDIDLTNKQVKNIKSYYDLLDNYTLYYDLPRFK